MNESQKPFFGGDCGKLFASRWHYLYKSNSPLFSGSFCVFGYRRTKRGHMMKKILKNNQALLFTSALLMTAQLVVIGMNMLTAELPWTQDRYVQGNVFEKVLILLMYFALGIAAVVCVAMAFTVTHEKKESARQNVSKITLCAMFLALYIVIQSAAIDITASMRITFNFLMYGAVGMFFGPTTGAIFGVAADITGFMVHSGLGGFFPAYTLIGAVKGIVYGVGLYRGPLHSTKKSPGIGRVAAVKAIDTVLCNLILITAANAFLYNAPFWTILPGRALKNLIMYPIETAMLYAVLKVLYDMNKKLKLKF